MTRSEIISFLLSAAGGLFGLVITYVKGSRDGRRWRVEQLAAGRRRADEAEAEAEMDGELKHFRQSYEIDWTYWSPERLTPLWRLMERDDLKPVGSPADPDFLMRLLRELDEQEWRRRELLRRAGVRARGPSFQERYEEAVRAIVRDREPTRVNEAFPQITIEQATPLRRGREMLLGAGYVFAFGQMPLTPVESFEQRLSTAIARVGSAVRTVEQDRSDALGRSRRVDER